LQKTQTPLGWVLGGGASVLSLSFPFLGQKHKQHT